jgi:hypothetical protein
MRVQSCEDTLHYTDGYFRQNQRDLEEAKRDLAEKREKLLSCLTNT